MGIINYYILLNSVVYAIFNDGSIIATLDIISDLFRTCSSKSKIILSDPR